MSETLVAEYQVDAPDNSAETASDWDGDLFALVAENAGVFVSCAWMPGTEVSLTNAMLNYPQPITAENVGSVIVEVRQLLASRVIETEEPEKADEPEEQAEMQKPQNEKPAKSEKKPAKIQERPANEKNKQSQIQAADQKNSKIEAQKGTIKVTTTSTDNQPNKPAAEILQPIVQAGKTEEASKSANSNETAEIVEAAIASQINFLGPKSKDSGPAEAPVIVGSSSGNSIRETIKDQAIKLPVPPALLALNRSIKADYSPNLEIEPKQSKATLNISDVEEAVKLIPAAEPKTEKDMTVISVNQEVGFITLPLETEVGKAETAESLSLDLENVVVPDEIPLPGDEYVEASEDEVLIVSDYIINIDSLTDFNDGEVLLGHDENPVIDNELYKLPEILSVEPADDFAISKEEILLPAELEAEPFIAEQTEATGSKQIVQESSTIEEIEDTLTQLAHGFEASEPEAAEVLNAILDEIIDLPARLEADNDENIITEAEAQEELEELFIELLNEMGIDYTPELIESLTSLTLKCHLAGEIEKLKYEGETETDQVPQKRGTHEIIRQLLASLSVIKRALSNACAIGKSALQLYSFNLAA